MDIVRYIKAALMLLLVGSSIVFSSAVVQSASNQAQTNLPTGENTLNIDFKEVQTLVFILAALGVAVFILVQAFQVITTLKMKDFLDSILKNSRHFALV